MNSKLSRFWGSGKEELLNLGRGKLLMDSKLGSFGGGSKEESRALNSERLCIG